MAEKNSVVGIAPTDRIAPLRIIAVLDFAQHSATMSAADTLLEVGADGILIEPSGETYLGPASLSAQLLKARHPAKSFGLKSGPIEPSTVLLESGLRNCDLALLDRVSVAPTGFALNIVLLLHVRKKYPGIPCFVNMPARNFRTVMDAKHGWQHVSSPHAGPASLGFKGGPH